jgi:hypothetical protein
MMVQADDGAGEGWGMAQPNSKEQRRVVVTVEPRAQLSISWQTATVVMTLIAVACLATLAFVVGINRVDTLSAVALALAILAFAAQIFYSIAQGQQAAQQLLQNERLYNQTQALLTDISLTSREIRGAQTGLIDRLLQGVLPSLPDAVQDAGVAPELQGAVVQHVSRTLREAASDALSPPRVAERPISAEDERIIELLRSFPDRAEGARSLELLARLSGPARDELRARARYELARRRLGRPVGQWGDVGQTPGLAELEAHALIERLDPPVGQANGRDYGDYGDYVALTDQGRRVARLLTGRGQPPDWLLRGPAHPAGGAG